MQTYQLLPHPAFPPLAVTSVTVRLARRTAQRLHFTWTIVGAGALVVPPASDRCRADGLWQTTCFELFVRPTRRDAYVEFNLSPSGRWNAYAFDSRRAGMREHAMARVPVCEPCPPRGPDPQVRTASWSTIVPAETLAAQESAMGLSCVIEEAGGVKSYWALTHAGEAPDFHDPACFTATLPAPIGG